MPYKDPQAAKECNRDYRQKNRERIRRSAQERRHNLFCGHCGARFLGTYHQKKHLKAGVAVPYCSDACRLSATRQRQCKPIPRLGPCPTCGKKFHSRRTDKKFCSMRCYTASEQFKEMLQKNRIKSAETRGDRLPGTTQTGRYVMCQECGVEIYEKKSQKRRFCCRVCYRAFMAKRFDRWVANPESLALPQCYDEFLDREELPCLIDGCGWIGKHLTLHTNFAHGIKADEFKRAAGFNLGTGVISKDLAQAYQARDYQGVASWDEDSREAVRKQFLAADLTPSSLRYVSLEAREHFRKARIFLPPGPERHCLGCGVVFTQTTPMGRAKYCSVSCRDEAYRREKKKRAKVRGRKKDGTFAWVDSPNEAQGMRKGPN